MRPRRPSWPGSPSCCGPRARPPEELEGLVATMLARAPPVPVAGRAVDLVGTGGDRAHTANISTMAALVVAGVRAHGGQARQPGGLVRVRGRGRARRTRCRHRPDGAGVAATVSAPASDSALRPSSIPASGTRGRRAANSASRRCSTSSVRSPTRAGRRPRRSGARTPGWLPSWRRCWPVGATRLSSSAATTASTS